MSYDTNTNTELLFAGPQAPWTQAAASVTTAQSLTASATGDAVQPYIRAFWWLYGRRNQALKLKAYGTLQAAATSTTCTFAFGSTTTGGGVITGTLNQWALFPAFTLGTASSQYNWVLELDVITLNVGWGTTSVSTQIYATGTLGVGLNVSTTAMSLYNTANTTVSVIDNSAVNYLYGSITFNAASASNTCQWNVAKLYGEN